MIKVFVQTWASYNDPSIPYDGRWISLPMENEELDHIMNALTDDGRLEVGIMASECDIESDWIGEYENIHLLNTAARIGKEKTWKLCAITGYCNKGYALDNAIALVQGGKARLYDPRSSKFYNDHTAGMFPREAWWFYANDWIDRELIKLGVLKGQEAHWMFEIISEEHVWNNIKIAYEPGENVLYESSGFIVFC